MELIGQKSEDDLRKELKKRFPNIDDVVMEREIEQARKKTEALVSNMSPAGALDLHPHLDERRREFGIPDMAFKVQAFGKWVFIWQIAQLDGDTYGEDSSIVVPDKYKNAAVRMAPQGIVLSMGLEATDILTSNGVQLGDVVWFVRESLWRIICGHIKGEEQQIVVLHAAEVAGCFDTRARLRDRVLRMKWSGEEHQYVTRSNETANAENM